MELLTSFIISEKVTYSNIVQTQVILTGHTLSMYVMGLKGTLHCILKKPSLDLSLQSVLLF